MPRSCFFLFARARNRGVPGSFPLAFRNWLGKVTGRGELQVLVRQKGLYDRDVARAWKTELYLRGGNASEVEDSVAREEKKAALERLIRRTRLEAAAGGESTDQAALEHGLELIRWEFRDENGHADSLGKSPWNAFVFRQGLKNQLRAPLARGKNFKSTFAQRIRNSTCLRRTSSPLATTFALAREPSFPRRPRWFAR